MSFRNVGLTAQVVFRHSVAVPFPVGGWLRHEGFRWHQQEEFEDADLDCFRAASATGNSYNKKPSASTFLHVQPVGFDFLEICFEVASPLRCSRAQDCSIGLPSPIQGLRKPVDTAGRACCTGGIPSVLIFLEQNNMNNHMDII